MIADTRDQSASDKRQNRFEQLETLRKAAWESIVSRRAVEWRVSIALWSLLAAFIASINSVDLELGGCARFALSLFPVMIAVGYVDWLSSMFEAYRIDKTEEGTLRGEMAKLADYQQDERVRTAVEQMVESRWRESDGRMAVLKTMHAPQILTTVLLAFLALFVVWTVPPYSASGGIAQKEKVSNESR